MFSCSWKESFGIECPSCGAQRSFFELVHGHFLESVYLFPALMPLMAVALITALHLIRPFKKGPFLITLLFACSAFLMFTGWICKMIV